MINWYRNNNFGDSYFLLIAVIFIFLVILVTNTDHTFHIWIIPKTTLMLSLLDNPMDLRTKLLKQEIKR
jgi:hypothetical protein